MFGYVTVCRKYMAEEDYSLFIKYYCGLCRSIGEYASQSARLGLSYDMTFLAILISGAIGGETHEKEGRCAPHPLKKRTFICDDPALEYAANMGVLLDYLKFEDDLHDEKSVKAICGAAAFHGAMKRACEKYPQTSEYIRKCLAELSILEKERCAEVDRCADCFARILMALFTPTLIEDTDMRRDLLDCGYNLGRWIYVIDAYNDMEKDSRHKNFNPFLSGHEYSQEYRESVRDRLDITLTYNLSELASAYKKLNIKKNASLLEHIIYCGLKARQQGILHKEEDTSDERKSK